MKTVRAIGFANEYYTLWDITTDVNYSGTQGNYKAFQTIHYHYLQNLSKDLNLAIEKAKNMGATCLEPDHELFGKNGYFKKDIRLDSKLPNNLSPFMEFGKYQDTLIAEVSDIEYLKWYYSETNNRYCQKILIDNGYKVLGFRMVTPKEYDEAMNIETIQNIVMDSKFIEVECDSNLKISDGIAYKQFNYMGAKLTFLFNQFQEMYYQGFSYALPLIDGKSKKIKGKKLKLYYDVIQKGFGVEYLVGKIEILN